MAAEIQRAYEGRRVCVTGGAGFIGSHLCDALVRFGADVTVLDDLSAGRRQNLKQVEGRIRLIEGSILDPNALAEATAGAEILFHHAALTSVPASVEQPERYLEVNAVGTLRVLEEARAQASPPRIVNASSSSSYGDRGQVPLVETMPPQPASPYAAAKCAGEHLLSAYVRCYGLAGVSLRYFNIFGPRQRPDSPYAAVIPRFAEALLAGRKPIIYGDGAQTRDFTHVANAVHANLLAGTAPGLRGQVVNIACGRSFDLLTLLRTMAGILGVRPDYELAPPRVGEVLHSLADTTAAAKLLAYRPVMHLEEGLRDALSYYQKSRQR